MTTLVIDASVAVKWVVEERGTDDALALRGGPSLIAPDLLLAECANILWKKTQRGELTRKEAGLAAGILARSDVELFPTRPLFEMATELAIDLAHPAYDCVYLALAMERDCPFVTADERLVARLAVEPVEERRRAVQLKEAARTFGGS